MPWLTAGLMDTGSRSAHGRVGHGALVQEPLEALGAPTSPGSASETPLSLQRGAPAPWLQHAPLWVMPTMGHGLHSPPDPSCPAVISCLLPTPTVLRPNKLMSAVRDTPCLCRGCPRGSPAVLVCVCILMACAVCFLSVLSPVKWKWSSESAQPLPAHADAGAATSPRHAPLGRLS